MQLTKPIFIFGCHKSGTSLFRSLLDGHPEIDFVYPNELHFFRVSGYSMEYPLGTRFRRPADAHEFARNALFLIQRASRTKNPFAPFNAHATLNAFRPDLFREKLVRPPVPAAESGRLLRYLDAVAAGFGYETSTYERPLRVVEKSVSNIEFAARLQQLCPDCHLVHIVRNAYANAVAIRRARQGPASVGTLRPFIEAIRLSFRHAVRNRGRLPGYQIIRYEDLVQDAESVMRDLCSNVGIGYSASLLEPTVLGRLWGGNSTSGKLGSVINRRPLDEWRDQITNIEIRLINRHLSDVMAEVGYGRERPRQHWLVPTRGERPSAYLANRLFLGRRRVESAR